jgi:hypothetical protein
MNISLPGIDGVFVFREQLVDNNLAEHQPGRFIQPQLPAEIDGWQSQKTHVWLTLSQLKNG